MQLSSHDMRLVHQQEDLTRLTHGSLPHREA